MSRAQPRGSGQKDELGQPLTPRQAEVADLLLEGATNAQIAHRLSITPKTVGDHIQAVFAKLGVHNRTAAARAWAAQKAQAGDYVWDSHESTLTFAHGRTASHGELVRVVRPLVSGLREVVLGSMPYKDVQPSATETHMTQGAVLKRRRQVGDRYEEVVAEFPQPLKADVPHRFVQVRTFLPQFGDFEPPWVVGPARPLRKAILRIQFASDLVPEVIWHFEDLPPRASPGPFNERDRLYPDRFGFVEHSFTNIKAEREFGFHWYWTADEQYQESEAAPLRGVGPVG